MENRKSVFLFYKTVLALFLLLVVIFLPTNLKADGPNIPYPFFLEYPYSYTGIRANIEVVDLDNPPGGELIMNQYRVDINLYYNVLGVYAKFPFAGVIDFGPSSEFGTTKKESEYDFGNIGIGAKLGLLNLDYLILTGGFEVTLPTTSNGLGAKAGQAYFRNFPNFINHAVTLDPYLVLGVGEGMFAFQANVDFDIITRADRIGTVGSINTGGDNVELIIKYGGAASITPPLPLPFSTTFLVELLLASSASFVDNITGVYLTPGVRFGGQIVNVGAGVQIPVSDSQVRGFANVDFLLDLLIRFGI